MMAERVVLDTNVFVAATVSSQGASRAILRCCLKGRCQPLIGEKLFREMEDVLGRSELFRRSPLSVGQRDELFDAYLSVCEWIPVYFLWRPNLPDEGDNHLVELAVAGGAESLVTQNVRDLRGGELHFPQIKIEMPKEFMIRWRKHHGDDDDKDS